MPAGDDSRDGNFSDIDEGSQIIFGNVPTIIKSVRNGR
jgi:hypothetical protein